MAQQDKMIILFCCSLTGNRNTDGTFNNRGTNTNLWSSTEGTTGAWKRNLNSTEARVNRNDNNKANGFSVRCLKDWLEMIEMLSESEHLYHQKIRENKGMMKVITGVPKQDSEKQLLYDLFQAYYTARKNKRSTVNALKFEMYYESKLFQLYDEIKNRKYEVSPSICFMSFEPVQREIFAGDFRDRIVHHLIYNYISPLFERLFIHDNYSCRVGKGTSYGIKRLDYFIRSCSRNYRQDCYILKLDIEGYFMSIERSILYEKIEKVLRRFAEVANFDIELVLDLIRKVIFHDDRKHCIIKGAKEDWKGLPKSKSLFYSEENRGLPIGNLTSQLFGNVYLNDFDHFIKYHLGIKYYSRYVDDFVIVHPDKEYLKSTIPILREYLKTHLLLELHPKKIYLQHFSKGVNFLGTAIKPYRIYIGNRTKGSFYKKIQYWNNLLIGKQYKLNKEDEKQFLSTMNSYLGIMQHYNTYKLRKKMLTQNLSGYFWKYVYISNNYGKLAAKIRKMGVAYLPYEESKGKR